MKIIRIELFNVKIPLADSKPGFFAEKPYFEPSWIPGYHQSEVRFYLLKLVTDTGLEGYAATHAMGTERNSLGSLLGNYMLGLNPLDINLINQRIQEMAFIGMRNGWMDAAIWDIIGKHRGEPVWKMMGGEGGYVYPYASTGATHDHDPKYAREIVRKHVDEGYKGVKLRIKSDQLDPMVQYIAAGREAAGSDVKLMVDANQGWPVDIIDVTPKWSVEFALNLCKAIEPYDLNWLEEPLNKGNFKGLAYLRKNTTVPLAGGEMNSSWTDFLTMLDMGCLDIYQPDAVLAGGTYAGGMSTIYWLIKEIEKRNKEKGDGQKKLKYCPHTWTTGLGFAMALQLYGVIPQAERGLVEYPLEGHWKPEFWARFIKGGFPRDKEGKIPIPDKPGLGIDIDWGIISKFGKRVYVGTPANVAITALKDRGYKTALYLKAKKEEQAKRAELIDFSLPNRPF